jgi:integrase
MPASNPKLCLHARSGRAFATFPGPNGTRRQIYFGAYGSDEAKQRFREFLVQWRAEQAKQQRPTTGVNAANATVAVLVARYLEAAEVEYRNAAGEVSREFANIVAACRPLLAVLRARQTSSLSCVDLEAVRSTFASSGDRCRSYVNGTMRRCLRVLRWGAKRDLVPGSVWGALSAFEHVRPGRGGLRDTKPVEAIPRPVVDAILPHLPPLLATAVELLWWSGMRAGELVGLRTRDVERAGEVWLYRPSQHKGAWRGRERIIYFGARCIELLRPLLKADPAAFLFSAADIMRERKAAWRAARQTPLTPSQRARDARNAQKATTYADCLDVATLRRAVHRACDEANVERFGLHRLRHAAGTRLVLEAGDEAARVQLGHADGRMVRRYSRAADLELGRKVAARHA